MKADNRNRFNLPQEDFMKKETSIAVAALFGLLTGPSLVSVHAAPVTPDPKMSFL